MRRTLIALFRNLLGLATLLIPITAHATAPPAVSSICSSYQQSAFIFRGRMVSSTVVPEPGVGGQTVHYPDGSSAEVYTVIPGGPSYSVVFDVLESFHGNPGSRVTLTTRGSLFRTGIGQEFLIFANPSSSSNLIINSGGAHSIKDASTDEALAWLRAYPKAGETAFLSGHIFMRGTGQMMVSSKSLPVTVAINITGNGVDKTITPSQGSYRLGNLPAGTYTVQAITPVGIISQPAQQIQLASKGCAEVDWTLFNDAHIRGFIADTSGKPLEEVSVYLLEPYSDGKNFSMIQRTVSTGDGRYDFGKIPEGDYLIALNPFGPNNRSPQLPVFYPASQSLSGARRIHIGFASSVENIDVTELPPMQRVTVHVSILREDGTPVPQAHVDAIDPLGPHQGMTATADASGGADLTLYAGRPYSLVVNTPGIREPACGGPVTFTATDGLTLEPIKFDKSFHDCRIAQRTALDSLLSAKTSK